MFKLAEYTHWCNEVDQFRLQHWGHMFHNSEPKYMGTFQGLIWLPIASQWLQDLTFGNRSSIVGSQLAINLC